MGVNLLPFIDRQRLVGAMRKADENGERLSLNEKERNKFGQVLLFFLRQEKSQSALQQTLAQNINGKLKLQCSYQRKDLISGSVVVEKGNGIQIG